MFWPSGFSSAVALGSICSAGRYRLLFAGFTATMATSDFSVQRHRLWVQRHRSATSKDQRHRSATLKLEATSQSANHLSQHNKNLIYGLRKAPSKPSSSFGASMSRKFTSTVALHFSQLYIIGFEFPLLSFAAPHDSEAVERPPRSRRSASERAMVLGPRDAPFRLTNAASGCCLRLVSQARRIRVS